MGQAVGDWAFAFWLPGKNDILECFNAVLTAKADCYIRKRYRHVVPQNRQKYYREYRFLQQYAQRSEQALDKLIEAGSASLWNYPLDSRPILRPPNKPNPAHDTSVESGSSS
jgi:hypothetical protein